MAKVRIVQDVNCSGAWFTAKQAKELRRAIEKAE